jgi:hypothetical protein
MQPDIHAGSLLSNLLELHAGLRCIYTNTATYATYANFATFISSGSPRDPCRKEVARRSPCDF